ncbi:hypothetical protein EMCRGX_G024608 [Ephydatia muelleri]
MSISKVWIRGGAGLICDRSNGVSIMQHGHLTPFITVGCNEPLYHTDQYPTCSSGLCRNAKHKGTLKLVHYVRIVGCDKFY